MISLQTFMPLQKPMLTSFVPIQHKVSAGSGLWAGFWVMLEYA
jgi:hypothetical protein